jgi:hypothetical protein
MNRKLIFILTLLAAMAAGRGMAAVATNSVAATNAPVTNDATTKTASASPNAKLDFDSFKLVRERNIFDMSRTGRIGPQSAPRRVIVDEFTLLGTINSGPYAIFEGSGSEYEKNVKAGDKIGSFKVSDIGSGYVDLVSTNGKTIRMGLSTTMRREDKGPWSGPTMRDDTILADSSSSSSRDTSDRSDRSSRSDRRLYRNSRSDRGGGSNSAAGMGDAGPGASTPDSKSDNSASSNENDIVKRLMERRAKESKDNQ